MKGAWTLSMQNESAARGACILAFDTANEVVAVGVGMYTEAPGGDPENPTFGMVPLACREIPAHRASNTILLNEVDATLAEAGVPKGDVAAVVCGRGPGSFTGVRICMATAKGAASALEVPLYGVSTLDAVAWRAWAEGVRGRVLVAADAMRKEVYPALFEISDSEISRLTTDAVVKAVIACEWVADQEAKLPERAGDLTILGDALVKYREIFEPLGAIADESLWAVSGAGLLLAAQAGLAAGDIDLSADAWHGESNAAAARANAGTAPVALRPGDPSVLLPVYTRLSDAEENERIRLAKEAPEKTDALSPRDLSTACSMPMSFRQQSRIVPPWLRKSPTFLPTFRIVRSMPPTLPTLPLWSANAWEAMRGPRLLLPTNCRAATARGGQHTTDKSSLAIAADGSSLARCKF